MTHAETAISTGPRRDSDAGTNGAALTNGWSMSMMDKMHDELCALELRCLALAARGRSREAIRIETDIPMRAIDGAFQGAMRKLKAGNVAEAIFRAARMKLI